MSEIKNKDFILEAIDQLRRRKARPDADRICNILLRRYSVCSKDTIADLERMVQAEIVIRVEYKGNISYRNAAKWSRLAVYKHKENMIENNNIVEIRSLLSRAFASLLVEDPDYLDFGVPENELKKSLLEEDPCLEWGDVDNILQREINSGYLVRLKNDNYSLADHPVPCTTNGNADCSDEVHVLKFDSPSLHFDIESAHIIEEIPSDSSDKNSTLEATDGNNRKNTASPQEDSKTRESDPESHAAPAAINVGGYRVGVRRKRAKKVFDPSDNNIPTRKRGRPPKNKDPNAHVVANNVKPEPTVVCCICRQGNVRRSQYQKWVSCSDCANKAHSHCLDSGEKNLPYWQCQNCKTCPNCLQSGEFEPLVICSSCGDGWHTFCHSTEIEKNSENKWFCLRCVPTKVKTSGSSMGNVSIPHESPTPDVSSGNYPASASISSGDSDEQIDESIPDASDWSVDEVSQYLSEQGYPEEAQVFKSHEIDGASLLLMKRTDVLLGLHLKLGPALKVYGQVKKLQIRRSEPHLLWG